MYRVIIYMYVHIIQCTVPATTAAVPEPKYEKQRQEVAQTSTMSGYSMTSNSLDSPSPTSHKMPAGKGVTTISEDDEIEELHYLFKGDYFGEEAILKPSRFAFTACGPVQCLVIPSKAFSEMILSKQHVREHLAYITSQTSGLSMKHPSSVNLLKNGPSSSSSLRLGSTTDVRSASSTATLKKRDTGTNMPGLTDPNQTASK